MHSAGKYPYCSVQAMVEGVSREVTFKEWGDQIQQHFEKHFWINTTAVPENESHPELINRRSMYKDSYYAEPFWTDFQLRPNFTVAMVVVSYYCTIVYSLPLNIVHYHITVLKKNQILSSP